MLIAHGIAVDWWFRLGSILPGRVYIHRVGVEQPFKPVETIPLHHFSVMQILSMVAGKPHVCTDGRSYNRTHRVPGFTKKQDAGDPAVIGDRQV
jgi:hypothetical protein